MSFSILAIVFSFPLSAGAVLLVLRLSRRHSWYDQIDERKIHTGSVPRLGGAGFASVFIVMLLGVFFLPGNDLSAERELLAPFLALLLILAAGIVDDFRSLPPNTKLAFQCLASLCAIFPGYVFDRLFLTEVFGNFAAHPWLAYALSFCWMMGLINAINLIDGVDGLAGGVSGLAAVTYGIIFVMLDAPAFTVYLCFSLAAVVMGFLVFNLPVPKARIFMGDGGSQFLGFTLAFLPLLGHGKGRELPMLYAAAILVIPIFDTFAAIWRRIRDKRRIDSPDRSHIHHKLLNLGLSAKGVDAMLCGLQLLLSSLTLLSLRLPQTASLALLSIVYLLAIAFFATIHFLNYRRPR